MTRWFWKLFSGCGELVVRNILICTKKAGRTAQNNNDMRLSNCDTGGTIQQHTNRGAKKNTEPPAIKKVRAQKTSGNYYSRDIDFFS